MKTGQRFSGILIILVLSISLISACGGDSTPSPATTTIPSPSPTPSPMITPDVTPATTTPDITDMPTPVSTASPTSEPTATVAPSDTPTPTPTGEEGWYWKPGGFEDYALSGMPDFDQLQDSWSNTADASNWTYCGPVAVANSLWWFDSKYESLSNSGTTAPPAMSDHYSMVESYNPDQWDDHDTQNVDPLVKDLAFYMNTDGQRTGGDWLGTYVNDMQQGIKLYLMNKGVVSEYDVHVQKSPEFSWIVQEVERCQDVVLLLGFWEWRGSEDMVFGDWVRLGGHYVTCAGVNYKLDKIGVSDPYLDNAEVGRAGRVFPAPHGYPHGEMIHNDAKYASHDIYKVVPSKNPVGSWTLDDYPVSSGLVDKFSKMNGAEDLKEFMVNGVYSGGPLHVEIDYAIAVSPVGSTPAPTPTATSSPTSTPTATPTPTATSTPTSGPPIGPPPVSANPPPVPTPDPNAQVLTGIHTRHHIDPQSGKIVVEVHCIPSLLPDDIDIFNIHFFTEDDEYLGGAGFDLPMDMEPCLWYTIEIDDPGGDQFIVFYLTDQNHNIVGMSALMTYQVAIGDVITPQGTLIATAPFTPKVEVWNLGEAETVDFQVAYFVAYSSGSPTEYTDIMFASVKGLPSGTSTEAFFPEITLEAGEYVNTFIAYLEEDMYPMDNEIITSFEVK